MSFLLWSDSDSMMMDQIGKTMKNKSFFHRIDDWLCIHLHPSWLRIHWQALWIRRDEFSPSFELDKRYVEKLNSRNMSYRRFKKLFPNYMAKLTFRRGVAHERSLHV